jgi:CHAD domain-containing protein
MSSPTQPHFRLDPSSEIESEAGRVFLEELGLGMEELLDPDLGDRIAVHSVRKRLKRLRAVLRLFRGELGADFRPSNRLLRDGGRLLSEARDAHVAIETLDRIEERCGAELNSRERKAFGRLRGSLGEASRTDLGGARAKVAALLEPAAEWPASWAFPRAGFGAMAPGLGRVYAAGRRAMAEAGATGSITALHEWRKRVKDHWHHTQLIGSPRHRGIRTRELRLHDLSDALGDLQDLRVLRAGAAAAGRARMVEPPSTLGRLLDLERDRLSGQSFDLGRRLFYFTPARLVTRYESAWTRVRGPSA